MRQLRPPYLLFLGDVQLKSDAKTAFGLRDWAREKVIGECRLPGCSVTLDLPQLSPQAAAEQGAGSLVIGIAPVGGQLPPHWIPLLCEALHAGLDLVSGLHQRLSDLPVLRDAAAASGCTLHDVRHSTQKFPAGTGEKRSGLRVLTVGTDCALGKKYTALAVHRELQKRGVASDFRATGQTGILIAGTGVAIDAVVADFIAGAAESLSPDAAADHWDIIEGQGALFHPAYAGVTLGLVHGSQPDALVLCHDPTRDCIEGYPHMPLPTLREALRRYLEAARLTNPAVRAVGFSINSSSLSAEQWANYRARLQDEFALPVMDPLREGTADVVDALLKGEGLRVC